MDKFFELAARFPRAQLLVRWPFLVALGLNVVARNLHRPNRMIRYLCSRMRSEGLEVRVTTLEHDVLTLLLPDTASALTYLDLPYDQDVYGFFDHVIEPGMVVVDAGANIGLMSRSLARRVGPDGHVVAFEPVPFLSGLLRRNVRDLNQVTVVDVALAAIVGEIDLRWYGMRWASQTSMRDPLVIGRGGSRVPRFTTLRVPAMTLDSWRKTFPNAVDAIKLDVEGAELEVLRGAQRLLSCDNPWLIVEVTSPEAFSFLSDFGYRVVAGPGERVMTRWRRACRHGFTRWPINLLFGAEGRAIR